jgi:hypothetical protein
MKNKKIILLSVLCIFLIIIENIIFSKLEDNYVTKKEVHIDEIKDYVVIDKLKVKEEDEPIILFGSDYQGDLRYTNSKELFEAVKRFITPNLFVVAGDYRVNMDDNYYESEKGIFELVLLFNDYFKDIPIITIQGNHDPYNTLGLPSINYFETDKYIVYVINEDDYPYNEDESSKEIVSNTSNKLDSYLKQLTGSKPVFIVTHVPLHYSTRNNGEDNKYAYILFNTINKYNNLDIVFLFGHNHSSTFDDYIGGSINYIPKGSTIKVGGTTEEVKLNFTYLNAGYIGNSQNTNTDTSTNLLTVTGIKVKKDELEIQKYCRDGLYYNPPIVVKRVGIHE